MLVGGATSTPLSPRDGDITVPARSLLHGAAGRVVCFPLGAGGELVGVEGLAIGRRALEVLCQMGDVVDVEARGHSNRACRTVLFPQSQSGCKGAAGVFAGDQANPNLATLSI